jgi:hypothetical protein
MGSRKMAKRKQVVRYWLDYLLRAGKYWIDVYFDDQKEAENVCFACGTFGVVERAHIVPKQYGGSDCEQNLHNLCRECHMESEILTEPGVYFEWFNLKTPQTSGSRLRQYNIAKLLTTKKTSEWERIIKQYPAD